MPIKNGIWFNSRKTHIIKINSCKNCGQMCDNNEIFCCPKCRRAYRKAKTAMDRIKSKELFKKR